MVRRREANPGARGLLLAAVVVGLGACSPSDPEPRPDGTGASASTASADSSGTDDVAPLDAYLGYASDPSATEIDPMLRAEELVAQCMAEQGFEYVPRRGIVAELAPGEPEWHTREYAERYGYGTFVQPRFVDRPVDPDGVDANAEILASMSLAERAAYDLALNGTSDGGVFRSGDDIDLEALGCEGLRIADLVNGDGKNDPVYVDATAHSSHIDEVLLGEDPRVAAADARWAECMSDAGWPGFAAQPDARELAESWSLALIDPETSAQTSADPQTLANEISLALADFDCTAATGLAELRDEVRAELQQEYVDEHREELESW